MLFLLLYQVGLQLHGSQSQRIYSRPYRFTPRTTRCAIELSYSQESVWHATSNTQQTSSSEGQLCGGHTGFSPRSLGGQETAACAFKSNVFFTCIRRMKRVRAQKHEITSSVKYRFPCQRANTEFAWSDTFLWEWGSHLCGNRAHRNRCTGQVCTSQ